jgi:hypothetical protein
MVQATLDTTVTGLQGNPVSATPPTVGQILIWNGTAWVPGSNINGPLTVQGNLTAQSVSGNMTATGNVSAAQVSASGAVQGGSFQNAQGVNTINGRAMVFPASSNNSPQFGGSTAMYGAGGQWLITPRVSGIIHVDALILCNPTGAGATNANMNVCFGTGTPPAMGAEQAGGVMQGINATTFLTGPSGTYSQVSKSGTMSGFTLGTQYWFDMVLWTGGNLVTFGYGMMCLTEL